MDSSLQFEITPQPNDQTCGPACLHAVYPPTKLDEETGPGGRPPVITYDAKLLVLEPGS